MKTDHLISILSHLPPTKRPLPLGLVALSLFFSAAVVTITSIGFRPELMSLQPPTLFWIKTTWLAAVMASSIYALTSASKPLPAAYPLWPAYLVGVIGAGLVINEWMRDDAELILTSVLSWNFLSCVFFVSVYGSVGMLVLARTMRHYAPHDTVSCAAWIGAVGAASGALGYSFHCPFDSPTFVCLAYGIPICLFGVLARRLLPRHLNW